MSIQENESRHVPQYPGDDSRPTSKRELAGWYCYGWAAEVFVVCAMGTCAYNLLILWGLTSDPRQVHFFR
jgi:MFS-type transporter involved in bile tolerance (Atg22 family)